MLGWKKHPILSIALVLLVTNVIILVIGGDTSHSSSLLAKINHNLLPTIFGDVVAIVGYCSYTIPRVWAVEHYGKILGFSEAAASARAKKYGPLNYLVDFEHVPDRIYTEPQRAALEEDILRQLSIININDPDLGVPLWLLGEYTNAPTKAVRGAVRSLLKSGELMELPRTAIDDLQVRVEGEEKYDPKVRFGASRRPSVVNQYGPNSRVNFNSHDASVNIVNAAASEVFNELKSAVAAAKLEATLHAEAIHHIEEMEQTHNTPAFKDRYQAFVTSAAMHATLLIAVTPFLPALALMVETLPK